MNVSCIVPVYNSESTLDELVERLCRTMSGCSSAYEVILVNDGSTDGSWPKIADLVRAYSTVIGINLESNVGQHKALLCGVWQASHEIVVTLDDDLQNPPESIPALLSTLESGYDLVYALPEEVRHRVWRKGGSTFLRLLLKILSNSGGIENFNSFRAFKTELRDRFPIEWMTGFSMDILTWKASRKTGTANVIHEKRKIGRSSYSFSKLMSLTFTMLAGVLGAGVLIAFIVVVAVTLTALVLSLLTVGFSAITHQPVDHRLVIGALSILFVLTAGTLTGWVHRRRVSGLTPYRIRERIGPGISDATEAVPIVQPN